MLSSNTKILKIGYDLTSHREFKDGTFFETQCIAGRCLCDPGFSCLDRTLPSDGQTEIDTR